MTVHTTPATSCSVCCLLHRDANIPVLYTELCETDGKTVIAMHHRPCCRLQGALMAKAIAVAVLGDEVLMPKGYRHSGLVWIYAAICGSIPAQGGLWWAADSLITGEAGRWLLKWCSGRSSCCAGHLFAQT